MSEPRPRLAVGAIETDVPKPPKPSKWGDLLRGMKEGQSFLVPDRSKSQLHYIRTTAMRLGIVVSLHNEFKDGALAGVRVFYEGANDGTGL